MPTSVTGRRTSRRRPAPGFTLLELVVVIAIVGVLIRLATLAVPDTARAGVALEADRLLAAIEHCRRGAVLSGVPGGIRIAADAWVPVRYHGGWAPAGGADAGRRLGEGLTLRAESGDAADDGDAPLVICLPTGETRQPVLEIGHRAAGARLRIAADVDGAPVGTWVEPSS